VEDYQGHKHHLVKLILAVQDMELG
jgi:hypothetical protein